MKVKITKSFETVKGKLKAGQVIDVKPKVANRWIADGVAEAKQ